MRIKIVDCRQFPVDKGVHCFLSLTRDTYRASHSTSVARDTYINRALLHRPTAYTFIEAHFLL